MGRGEVILHDDPTLCECEQYINYQSGGLGPAALTEEPSGAREAHGDRVIGLAGANLLLREITKARMPSTSIPIGSFAYRRRLWEREQKRKEEW